MNGRVHIHFGNWVERIAFLTHAWAVWSQGEGRSQIKYIPVASSFLFWTVSLFQVQRAAIPKFIWGTVVTCSFWCWAQVCLWADGWRLCKPLAGVTQAEGLEGGSLCSSLFEKHRTSCVPDISQSPQQGARVNIFLLLVWNLFSHVQRVLQLGPLLS